MVDSNTLATNVEGVFAGGDFVTGPGMVIEAIAAGRRASIAIDKYLNKDSSRVEMYDLKKRVIERTVTTEADESWEEQPRLSVPLLPPDKRKTNFDEVELCFSEETAQREAKRCLRCDLET